MSESEDKISPVFVLGLQRSGTTRVANQLASHPLVAAVEAEEHYGVHESIFFSHFARAYGDLKIAANFERFVDDFTASDYFLITGLDDQWFRSFKLETYSDAFRLVMDEVALRRGATYWLEKSPHHSLMADQLARLYPDAWFVCITRSPAALIRSRIMLNRDRMPSIPKRLALIIKGAATWSLYTRYLRRFCRRYPQAILTMYERLDRDLEAEMRRISEFLGIPFESRTLETRYRANTSFPNGRQASHASFGPVDRLSCRVFATLMSLVPLFLLISLERRRNQRRGVVWPDWCWSRKDRPSLRRQKTSAE